MGTNERRTRSKERFASIGIPVIEGSAPPGDEASILPSPEEALRRAMILAVTGMVGDGLDRESAGIDLDRWELRPHLTPDEAAFLENDNSSVMQSAAYCYRQEGAMAILWALGRIASLDAWDPDATGAACLELLHGSSLDSLVQENSQTSAGASGSPYRPVSDILDAEDFLRLYREAYVPMVPPDTALGMELESGPLPLPVVSERLSAIEWMLRGTGT